MKTIRLRSLDASTLKAFAWTLAAVFALLPWIELRITVALVLVAKAATSLLIVPSFVAPVATALPSSPASLASIVVDPPPSSPDSNHADKAGAPPQTEKQNSASNGNIRLF